MGNRPGKGSSAGQGPDSRGCGPANMAFGMYPEDNFVRILLEETFGAPGWPTIDQSPENWGHRRPGAAASIRTWAEYSPTIPTLPICRD